MDCPQCGFVLDAFSEECPRCARMRAKGISAPATASSPAPSLSTQAKTAVQETAQSIKVVPLIRLPVMDTPELGWPLTILLWLVIGLHGLLLLMLVLSSINTSSDMSGEVAGAIAGIKIVLAIGLVIRLAALIGILRCKRWAFYFFTFFSVVPAFFTLMRGGGDFLQLALNVVPAIAIFFLVLSQWDEFE